VKNLSRILDMGLQLLTERLKEMFSLGIESFQKSMDGLFRYRNVEGEVYEYARRLRDLYEEISDIATELIARYQPVARDLRYIRSCMNIAYDVLRVGRYALEVTRSSRMLGSLLECDLTPIAKAREVVEDMLSGSIQAFLNNDLEAARRVREMDVKIDEIYRESLRAASLERGMTPECGVAVVLALRNLERLADHATNICDAVEYVELGHTKQRA